MDKLGLVYGFLIGVTCACLGSFLFITLFTDYNFAEGIHIMQAKGFLGKLITLGAILNVIAFFILLRMKKDIMARGVILATIILTILTILV